MLIDHEDVVEGWLEVTHCVGVVDVLRNDRELVTGVGETEKIALSFFLKEFLPVAAVMHNTSVFIWSIVNSLRSRQLIEVVLLIGRYVGHINGHVGVSVRSHLHMPNAQGVGEFVGSGTHGLAAISH